MTVLAEGSGARRLGSLTALALMLALAVSPAANAEMVGDRWTPSPGQAFNDGWVPFPSGANFRPCQTVRWHMDRANEPGDGAGLITDVREGLARLQAVSGLKFAEVASPADADVTIRWADLPAERGDEGATADATITALGKGAIRFDIHERANKDEQSGWGLRQIYYTYDSGQRVPWYVAHGRQVTVVHEMMHVMGYDHTPDFTSVMYSGWATNGSGEFSSGDLTGLKTMYLDRPCNLDSDKLNGASTTPGSTPSSDPDTRYQTCVKLKSEPASCAAGLAWTYENCWNGAPGGAVLQQWINGAWKTVKRNIARNDSCDTGYPWTVRVTRQETTAGTKKYRIYIPARGQFGSTTDLISVTVQQNAK